MSLISTVTETAFAITSKWMLNGVSDIDNKYMWGIAAVAGIGLAGLGLAGVNAIRAPAVQGQFSKDDLQAVGEKADKQADMASRLLERLAE